jgi:hypothetical protein
MDSFGDMPLPNVVETFQFITINDSVTVCVAVIVSHTKERKQFRCRVCIDLF